jgi:hypothetical protein
MILRRENRLLGPLEGVSPGNLDFFGPKWPSFRFPGPTPSNGPRNGYCPPQNHYVSRHINNRYMNGYCTFTLFIKATAQRCTSLWLRTGAA